MKIEHEVRCAICGGRLEAEKIVETDDNGRVWVEMRVDWRPHIKCLGGLLGGKPGGAT